jgi:hypothetical protein
MATFAQCFWEDNAGDHVLCPFQDQDTVFLLSFAIIMLNTELHKRSLPNNASKKQRKKMTKTEFFNNLRGAARNDELSQDYLSTIYDSIEEHPIVLEVSNAGESSLESRGNLSNELSCLLDNVKSVDALLRGLSIHEYRYATLQDFSQMLDYSVLDGTEDLTRSCVVKTWHLYHGLINAALENAHLDLEGMESCVDILKYALFVAVSLHMPMERAAFLGQLGRFKVFNARRRGKSRSRVDHESYKQEEWYKNLDRAIEAMEDERSKLDALETLRDFMKDLGSTLLVNVKSKKAMKDAVSQLRNAEYLLNDPARTFIKAGNLFKRANRSGREVEYCFFLFSDVLIYAKKTNHGGGTGRPSYKIHEELPLIMMKVVDWFPPGLKGETKAFQIYHPRKQVLVLADSKEERKAWVNAIRAAISSEMELKVALQAARNAAAKSH